MAFQSNNFNNNYYAFIIIECTVVCYKIDVTAIMNSWRHMSNFPRVTFFTGTFPAGGIAMLSISVDSAKNVYTLIFRLLSL